MRCLYVDLDGTLLGRNASLLHDGEGNVSLLGARALEACHRAEVEVVIYSGRRRAQVHEDARLIGARAYTFEAGAALSVEGETTWLTDPWLPEGEQTVHDQIERAGAPGLLLDHYAGRLEHHEPWHRERECSHLFRGLVDTAEAEALLRDHGHEDLRLLDNGVLEEDPARRAYHLVPRGVSKVRAVALHQRIRGYAPEECVAVGDSREDVAVAGTVGTFWLVANADPDLRTHPPHANVRTAGAAHGAGVYEAVVTTLVGRRGG